MHIRFIGDELIEKGINEDSLRSCKSGGGMIFTSELGLRSLTTS